MVDTAAKLKDIAATGEWNEEWFSWYLATFRENPHILCQTVKDHLVSHPCLQTWEDTPSRAYMSMAVYGALMDMNYAFALWKCINYLPCYYMKRDPSDLVHKDRRVRHLFCYFGTEFDLFTAGKFTNWLDYTSGTPQLKEEKPLGRESDALNELNAITAFAKELSSIFSPPTCHKETDTVFLSLWEDVKFNFDKTRSAVEANDLSGRRAGFKWLGLDMMEDLKDLESGSPYDATLSPEIAATTLSSLHIVFRMCTGNTMGDLLAKLVRNFVKQCGQLEFRNEEEQAEITRADRERIARPFGDDAPECSASMIDSNDAKEDTEEVNFWGSLDVEPYIMGFRNLPFAC
ncbi:hypothetical protein IL306_002777 [Fusarium sp. DS 682]|nr:hypothetical protein IL306_002777 [Fusarium sp. DS 682]